MTKALTSPLIRGVDTVSGVTLLPVMTLASAVSMIVTITGLGWWRYARRIDVQGKRYGMPMPNRWTLLSGFATAMVIVTTTLAYTFDGVSITFVMLIMRGGVLVIAPMVDALSGRRIRWFSWLALALSLVALGNAVVTNIGVMPWLCVVDLACYLLGYVVRLRLMAKLGKSDDQAVRRRYFVQEQMVAAPAAVILLSVLALLGPLHLRQSLRVGFVELWQHSTVWWAVAAGIFSQGTGIFGGLMLLDASEATYCVPLNRAMSILGGLAAATLLAILFSAKFASRGELFGAGMLVFAVLILWIGPTKSMGLSCPSKS
jgi:hypothetical protein